MKISERQLAGKAEGYVKTLAAVLNPEDNGGESIELSVDLFDNGDGNDQYFTNTTLKTNCYGTSNVQMTFYCCTFAQLVGAVNAMNEKLKEMGVKL